MLLERGIHRCMEVLRFSGVHGALCCFVTWSVSGSPGREGYFEDGLLSHAPGPSVTSTGLLVLVRVSL